MAVYEIPTYKEEFSDVEGILDWLEMLQHGQKDGAIHLDECVVIKISIMDGSLNKLTINDLIRAEVISKIYDDRKFIAFKWNHPLVAKLLFIDAQGTTTFKLPLVSTQSEPGKCVLIYDYRKGYQIPQVEF